MRTSFQTTNGTGLNYQSPPMILWQKAKKYGIWNPADLDFSQDAQDWQTLNDEEKKYISRLVSQFQAGEEAVTLDLLPLIMTVAKEGRLEEEMFLTSFLWEEAKHVEGFNRFIHEVIQPQGDLSEYLMPSYQKIFYEMLPDALNALLVDASPVNQARASVTYNMVVEGVLAETGYHSMFMLLTDHQIMPGLSEFANKLKQDESRHVAYGVFLISRLVAEHGDEVWQAVEEQMHMVMQPAMSLIEESYAEYEVIPFNVDPEFYKAYAQDQFEKRWARIERARHQTLDEIYKVAKEAEPVSS